MRAEYVEVQALGQGHFGTCTLVPAQTGHGLGLFGSADILAMSWQIATDSCHSGLLNCNSFLR